MTSGFTPNDVFALGEGFSFGFDKDFSPELHSAFQDAGVLHLIAANGSKLSLFTRLLTRPLNGVSFWTAHLGSLLVVLAYWSWAEQSGSLWRAVLNWLFLWSLRIAGKNLVPWWSLAWVVIITTIFFSAWMNLGFWMSSLAIVSIFFSRLIYSGEKKRHFSTQNDNFRYYLEKCIVIGTLIFLAVAIITWTQFQSFQPIGIVANEVLRRLVDPYIYVNSARKIITSLFGQKASVVSIWIEQTLFFVFSVLLHVFVKFSHWPLASNSVLFIGLFFVGRRVVRFFRFWRFQKTDERLYV